jgi:hypothetical protein
MSGRDKRRINMKNKTMFILSVLLCMLLLCSCGNAKPAETTAAPVETQAATQAPTTEPTEPSTKPAEPTTKPTEPTTKPGANGEEIPKTDNNGMVIYFAVMMAAAFAVLFTVLLGKKKYMV